MPRIATTFAHALFPAFGLAVASLVAFTSSARADTDTDTAQGVTASVGHEPHDHDLPVQLGVMADLGVPDGFVGSLSVRAYDRVELHVGGGHNSMSPGVRAGIQVAALARAISPYAALEGGHYFPGQASTWAKGLAAGAGLDESIELDRVGYSYGNAHLGLRLGARSAAFFVQAGVSVVHLNVTVSGAGLPAMAPVDEDGSMAVPTISKWTPSGRVGMVAFF